MVSEQRDVREPVWRQCERRWAEWLLEHNYDVEPLAEAEGNVPQTPRTDDASGGRPSACAGHPDCQPSGGSRVLGGQVPIEARHRPGDR